jgi:hypothetical protein
MREPTEWQHIRNQIDAAFVFARADFVNVLISLTFFVAPCEFTPADLAAFVLLSVSSAFAAFISMIFR